MSDELDDILSALDDVAEARRELSERQVEYTGYSPSWALASWYEAEQKAKDRLKFALDAYVDARIAAKLGEHHG